MYRKKQKNRRKNFNPSVASQKNSLGYPGHEKNKSFEYPGVVKLLKR